MSLEGRKKNNKNQNCFTNERENPIIGGVHLQDKNLRPKHVDLTGGILPPAPERSETQVSS